MKKITIGLIWQSPKSSNLGLAALALSNISIISDEAKKIGRDVEFKIFSAKTPKADLDIERVTEYIYLSKKMTSIMYAIDVMRKLKSCDIVFDVGEGDSFSDIYGWKRFVKISLTKFLVPNAKSRLILSPQTIGPFGSKLAEIFAKASMVNTKRIFARDGLSLQRAQGLLKSKGPVVSLTTDMAFALPIKSEHPSYFPVIARDKINVGINVSGLLYRGGYTGENQFSLKVNYRELIDGIIGNISNDERYKVWLVPHVHNSAQSSIESDRSVSEDIANQYINVSVAPAFKSAIDAKTFIASMDYFTGARMHATIAAISTGTACTPMSYSPKFEGLYSSIGYGHVLTLREVETKEAIAKVLGDLDNRAQIKLDAVSASNNAISTLANYRDFVRDALISA